MNTFPCITELRIEGFKSFGSPMQCLTLGPLSFIVGANASGKTNMLAALQFLKSAVLQNVEYACNEFGGILEVQNRTSPETNRQKPVSLGFKMSMGWTEEGTFVGEDHTEPMFVIHSFDYQIRLDLSHDDQIPRIEEEILQADIRDVITSNANFPLCAEEKR